MDTTFTADRIVASALKASPTTRKFADLSASRERGGVGGNDEFKRLYAGIFSLRRNAAWRRRYFEVMEGACRLKAAKLCDLLYLVSRIGERPALELRLASALLSVANPKMPAWTEPFRVALGVAAPAFGRAEPLEEQVASALASYDALLKAARRALANGEVRRGLAEAARRDPVFGSLPQMRQLEVALTAEDRTEAKRIYIYCADDGEECTAGARVELSTTASGDPFAVVLSPDIDKLWRSFKGCVAKHSIKYDSANTLLGDLALTLRLDEKMPFTCYRKAGDSRWTRTERRNAADGEVRGVIYKSQP